MAESSLHQSTLPRQLVLRRDRWMFT
jgi:hypothetical protein